MTDAAAPTATTTPSLSVVTVTWNHAEDVREFLEAIATTQKEVPFPIEMVIVDNASRDNTADVVEREFPWVKLIRTGKNLGFAQGSNVGLEAATGSHLLLLNPDARANAKAFMGMMDYLHAHPKVGCVGCMLLHADGLPQQSSFAELSPLSYWTNHSMLYPVLERVKKLAFRMGLSRKQPYATGWMQGACLLVPRAVYEKVGGMEASFFLYCEDTDWCHRIRKAGYGMVHMPNLTLYHSQMSSAKKKPEYTFRRVYRSIVHYTNRQFSGSEADRIFAAVLWDFRLRIPIYSALGMLLPARRDALRARVESARRLVQIIKTRNPDLYDDPPPS